MTELIIVYNTAKGLKGNMQRTVPDGVDAVASIANAQGLLDNIVAEDDNISGRTVADAYVRLPLTIPGTGNTSAGVDHPAWNYAITVQLTDGNQVIINEPAPLDSNVSTGPDGGFIVTNQTLVTDYVMNTYVNDDARFGPNDLAIDDNIGVNGVVKMDIRKSTRKV